MADFHPFANDEARVFHIKMAALNEASKQMVGKIKDLYYDLSFEVNAEIKLVENKVQHAEKGTQQAQEKGAAQAVIKHAEASTEIARREGSSR